MSRPPPTPLEAAFGRLQSPWLARSGTDEAGHMAVDETHIDDTGASFATKRPEGNLPAF